MARPAPEAAVPAPRRVPKPSLWFALLLLAGQALALDPDKAFHHYVRNQWSIEEGLPQISGLAIAQDRTGYLWVGTQAGLARFDGVRFTTFDPETAPGLRGMFIHDLHVDPRNRVWVATYRGVSVYENGFFRSLPVAGGDDGTALDTTDLAALPSGEIMVAAPDGVYRATESRLERVHALPLPATSLLVRGESLWVGSHGRVYRIGADGIQVMPLPEGEDDTVVTHLLDAHGRLWAGTTAGLFFRESDRWLRYEGDAKLASSPVEALYEDRDGNLWVALVDDLARLRAGRVVEVVRGDDSSTAVRAIFEDREGNLWLGTQWEGVTRVWNGWTRRFSVFEGLEDPVLWSVARGPGGRLWVGKNDGVAVMRDGRFETVVPGSALPHPNAYTLLPEQDVTWIGTRRGAAVLRGDKLEIPAELAPMRSAQINGIVRDGRGALWFATTQGLYRLTREGLQGFGTAHGLRDARIRVLHETRAGRLLVGSHSGLFEFDDGRLLPVGADNGLRQDLDITAIHELPDGRLLVGALSEEIFLFDGKAWHGFDKSSGMPVNSPFFMSEDAAGFLWVAGIRGVHRVPLADMADFAAGRIERVRGEMLLNERGDRRGGQKGYCCNGAGNAKGFAHDGELWLPTRDGVVALRTDGIVKNATAPRTVIERIRVGELWRPADPSADWRLPPEQRDLGFEFTVLSLQDPKSVQLRYRLVGYDKDWQQLDDPTRRSVNYTNLPPGAYVFEAQGSNNAETWSPATAQVGFSIQPWFHETPLFWWLLAGLLGSIGWAAYRRQLRKHLRQREALEQLVSQRTEALEVANHRLEEASQTDPLTGLRNRRYLATQIPADIAYYDRETVRRGAPDEVMVFALIDIDHFKAINDNHGHQAGDRVLQQMAQVLTQMVRTGDYIARWGGEEFLVVFRPMPNRHLPILGERICQAVSSHRFDVGAAEPLQVTCSVGFIECPLFRDARGGLGWEQMIELADRALYFVKAHGRNGWAAYRARTDTDLGELQRALRGEPGELLESGRLDLLASAHLLADGKAPGP